VSPVSQKETQEEKMLSSRIHIGIEQLSSRQQKTVLGLIKEMGFAKEEIGELVIRMEEHEETESA